MPFQLYFTGIFKIQNCLIIYRILTGHTKSFLFCLLYSDAAELPLNPSAPNMEQENVSIMLVLRMCMIVNAVRMCLYFFINNILYNLLLNANDNFSVCKMKLACVLNLEFKVKF